LPRLESNPNISLIVIAHGNPEAVFGLNKPLPQNNYVLKDKVLHVGNYEQNDAECCWRRWALIKLLVDRQIITSKYIFSQDDDILFGHGEIEKMQEAHLEKAGILISGAPGRNTSEGRYSYTHVNGPCEIVLGRAIFSQTKIIYDAIKEAQRLSIPHSILKEDDICMSFLTRKLFNPATASCHYSIDSAHVDLEDDYALCKSGNHSMHRDAAVKYFMNEYNTSISKVNNPSTDSVSCFIYWDKGAQHMPPFIKHIYEHNMQIAQKYKFKLILIDDSNVHTFFTPPIQFLSLAPNFRSDIVRFNVLHTQGGFWLDTDGILIGDMNNLWANFKQTGKAILLDEERADKKCGTLGCASLAMLPYTDVSRFCVNHINTLLDAIPTLKSMKWDFLGPTTVSMVAKIYPEQVKINNASHTKWGCNYILARSWRPGLEYDSWLLGQKAQSIAEALLNNTECFFIFTWSLYRINTIGDNIVDFVFKNTNSLFYHLLNLSKSR